MAGVRSRCPALPLVWLPWLALLKSAAFVTLANMFSALPDPLRWLGVLLLFTLWLPLLLCLLLVLVFNPFWLLLLFGVSLWLLLLMLCELEISAEVADEVPVTSARPRTCNN